MLVHIKSLFPNKEYDGWDYDHAETIGFYEIKSYDKFVKFVQILKKHHKDIVIGNQWYTVEDYAFSFPENSDSLPCLYVYVVGY